jgi:hypothetical protein
MIRHTYAIFIKCNPPIQAISIDGTIHKLPIDLKKAFHHTYIDTHGIEPKIGTNPIYDEYEQLLANSDELRFIDLGIANNTESKIRESGKLGRGIARFILSEYYGYKYFANIQNLIGTTSGEFKLLRTEKGGNTPDWFISDGDKEFCLGEAKGTHSEIDIKSNLVNSWREQCENIIVKKGAKKVKLKSWLIATRFVTEEEVGYKPEQLIEDPETSGEELNKDEYFSCNSFIAKSHIFQSLIRTSNFKLAVKLDDSKNIEGKVKALTWSPIITELKHLEFIGQSINKENLRYYDFFHNEDENIEWLIRNYSSFNLTGYFDGIAFEEVFQFFDRTEQKLPSYEIDLRKYPFISLLNDGSILIPMNLMIPKRVIEIY